MTLALRQASPPTSARVVTIAVMDIMHRVTIVHIVRIMRLVITPRVLTMAVTATAVPAVVSDSTEPDPAFTVPK